MLTFEGSGSVGTIFLGLLISLTIEVLQTLLPTLNSGMNVCVRGTHLAHEKQA